MFKFKSKLSWAALVGFGLVVACFITSTISANTLYTGVTNSDSLVADFSSRPLVSIPMLIAGVAALATLTAGMLAIIKFKERSALVIAATVIATLIVVMTLLELIFQG